MSSRTVYEELIPRFLLDAEITPACAEADPDAFFPIDDDTPLARGMKAQIRYADENGAKAVCAECPLKVECLIFAVRTGQQGIWGGTTENERKALRRRYR